MTVDKQIQKAGNHSQLTQAGTINNIYYNGIDEERVREIAEKESGKGAIGKLRHNLQEFSGKLLPRSDADKILGSLEERLNTKDQNGRRITCGAALVCYTGASFVNKKDVEEKRRTSAESVSSAFMDFIKSDRVKFDLIITSPFSNAANDAARFGKLGNAFKVGCYGAYENTTEPFENSYMQIKKLIKEDEIIKKKLEKSELTISTIEVSLPYALMKVEHRAEHANLDHIRLDLYSPFLASNSDRKTIIIAREVDGKAYETFSREIDSYKEIGKRIRDIDDVQDIGKGIHIFESKDYEAEIENSPGEWRRYFSGREKFGREDTEISNIELGISTYKKFKCDRPHYHLTTNEHYYIVSGQQKILDIRTGEEFLAKAGDVVFIRKRTQHLTKNAPGTKIVFAKAPLKRGEGGKDKEKAKMPPGKENWAKSWE